MTPAEMSNTAHTLTDIHSPSEIRRTLSIKKSTYYYKSIPDDLSVHKSQRAILTPLVKKSFVDSKKTYGVVRIAHDIRRLALPFKVGFRRIRSIMRQNALFCDTIKRFRLHSRSKVYELGSNLLDRKFSVPTINTVWVTDITYIFLPGYGFTYLTTFIDLASRKPVGWHYSKNMTTDSVILALKNALKSTGYPKNVMIHSDRGSQFTSAEFRNFLSLMNLSQSLSTKGCPYDNAVIESFHSSLKKELVYRTYFLSFEHAKLHLFDYIENFYIRKRLHSALGYITPQEMENRLLSNTYAAA